MAQKRKNISREFVDSDDSGEDGASSKPKSKPKAKKQKVERAVAAAESGDEEMIPLSTKRFVKVRMFNGRYLVDIREYWSDGSDELKPGKKGISLTLDQWEKLKAAIPDVDRRIHGD